MAENEVLWRRKDDMHGGKYDDQYDDSYRDKYGDMYDDMYDTCRRYILHVIQKGDTFFNLARRYGVSVNETVRHNPCADPENLQVGQIVVIPCPRRQKREGYYGDPPDYYSKK